MMRAEGGIDVKEEGNLPIWLPDFPSQFVWRVHGWALATLCRGRASEYPTEYLKMSREDPRFSYKKSILGVVRDDGRSVQESKQ